MIIITQILSLLVLGVGIGTFGTLIGVGGGFLTVPLLIIVYGFEPGLAVGTSLVFVFFNTLSGSLAYLKQKRVDVKIGLMFAALTILGSILGAYLTNYFDFILFKIAFSALLIFASLYIVAKPLREQSSKQAGYHRRLVDFQGNVYKYSVNLVIGLAISFGVGFISSIFGIGGGIIHVPAMILLLGFPVHISTATSHFILVFSSLVGSTIHTSLGNVNFDFAIPISIGALIGAQIGALISRMTKGKIIERLLGFALIIVAIRFLLQAL